MSVVASNLLALAAFNLVCTGTQMSAPNLAEGSKLTNEPFREVYRVNLDSRRWCRDECAQTWALAGLSDTIISVEDASDYAATPVTFSTVNRESGIYRTLHRDAVSIVMRRGSCKRASFSGLPARKF